MTATHSPTPEDLMAHLDGELTAEASRDVQAHLAVCETCQRVAGELRLVSADMKTWSVEEPPKKLPAGAPGGDGTRGERSALSRRWSVWHFAHARVLAAAAAAVVLIVVAVTLNSPARKQPRVLAEAVGSVAAPAEGIDAAKPGVRAQRARTPDSLSSSGVVAGQEGGGGAGNVGQPRQGAPAQGAAGPQVVRTVTLRIVASDFDAVRPSIDRALRNVGGFVGQLGAADSGSAPRSIRGTLRVPAARLDEVVALLKTLGRVIDESQQAEDVTEQVVDLDVRISNARITEKRLADLVQNRTGRVSDVLEAEREMARVRTELERLDAQRKNVAQRVAYATLVLEVLEERRAGVDLGAAPVPARLRHAIADGFDAALSSALEATLFALRVGPGLVLWSVLLGVPGWMIVRRMRPHRSAA
jgi:Domain of unknown function (DUF4349)/Putative zinc-finger